MPSTDLLLTTYYCRYTEGPYAYSGKHEVADFVAYINHKAGCRRTSSGKLGKAVGLAEEIDTVVAAFYKAAAGDTREKLLKDVEGLQHLTNAKFYSKMLAKVNTGGHAVVAAEHKRITSMIEGRKVKKAQIKKFEEKINILRTFDEAEADAAEHSAYPVPT